MEDAAAPEPAPQDPAPRPKSPVGAIVAGVALVVALVGGPLLLALLRSDGGDGDGTDVGTPDAVTSTTSGVVVENPRYEVGDCAVWDTPGAEAGAGVEAEAAAEPRARVVPCEQPHFVEIAGFFEVDGSESDGYPTMEEWVAVVERGQCLEIVNDYLDAPHDPHGWYPIQVLWPTEAGWEKGDRRVSCGLGRRPLERSRLQGAGPIPFAGRVSAEGQQRVFPVGACLASGGEGRIVDVAGTVPCDGPHVLEVTGHADLIGADDWPGTDPEAWKPFVQEACDEARLAYVDSPDSSLDTTFLLFHEESWAAGRRTVECGVVERRADGSFAELTGRMGAGDDVQES